MTTLSAAGPSFWMSKDSMDKNVYSSPVWSHYLHHASSILFIIAWLSDCIDNNLLLNVLYLSWPYLVCVCRRWNAVKPIFTIKDYKVRSHVCGLHFFYDGSLKAYYQKCAKSNITSMLFPNTQSFGQFAM